MNKKAPNYVKFLLICLFSLSSCVSGCTSIPVLGSGGKEIYPRTSFVQIRQFVKLEGCGVDPRTKEPKCQTAEMRYVSSGAYVFHSEVSEDVSYALTAGHSCENSLPKEQNIGGFRIVNKGSRFKVVDLDGLQHDATVVNINKRFDLCLLKVHDVHKKLPILKIADKEPPRGSLVTNLAAPPGS